MTDDEKRIERVFDEYGLGGYDRIVRERLAAEFAAVRAPLEQRIAELERENEGGALCDRFETRLLCFYATHGGDGYLGGEGEDSADPADWMVAMAEHVCIHFIDQRDEAKDELASCCERERANFEEVKLLRVDLASANESLDQLTDLYQEKCDRLSVLTEALRELCEKVLDCSCPAWSGESILNSAKRCRAALAAPKKEEMDG
jgi:hypothetical protein